MDPTPKKRRPTIHELAEILNSREPTTIRIGPDGSITTEPDCEEESPIDDRIRAAVAARDREWMEMIAAAVRRIAPEPAEPNTQQARNEAE